jgi:hypothetical protein
VADTAAGYARTAAETTEAQAYGLTSDDLRDWAFFSPIEICWAVKHDVTAATARRWAREELRACDTVRAIALEMTPEEVRVWAGAGFAPRKDHGAGVVGVVVAVDGAGSGNRQMIQSYA